jgi:uncharacterized Zn-binding protein involved in type VI secretion
MPKPLAKEDDKITAMDTHLVEGSPFAVPFLGKLDARLSPNVIVEHKRAAVVGSQATNAPGHLAPPGKTFDLPPKNCGTVIGGSKSVLINGHPAVRDGDGAATCNDPGELPVGAVVAAGTVLAGD